MCRFLISIYQLSKFHGLFSALFYQFITLNLVSKGYLLKYLLKQVKQISDKLCQWNYVVEVPIIRDRQ